MVTDKDLAWLRDRISRLDINVNDEGWVGSPFVLLWQKETETLRRIEAALLAQKQEPVAWTEPNELARFADDELGHIWRHKENDNQIPLYAAPPAPAVTESVLGLACAVADSEIGSAMH